MSARHRPSFLAELPPPEDVGVEKLLLDAENPRLAGLELDIDQQDEIVEILWQDRAVNELVDSIAASGYWRHEELFASREHGKLVVVEGNRRLAAVKLLTDPKLCERLKITSVPSITARVKSSLTKLPVIICERADLWQYIGFKHVNGPQDWDSIAKADYIARVHEEYGQSLPDIARSIGDRHDTVARLYRGLAVLKQAEKSQVFDRHDRYNTRFAYSHLWTGLGYSNIQDFLGISKAKIESSAPVSKSKLKDLGQLCLWLYGSRSNNRPPLIRSQNPDLRNLDEALGSPNGIAALQSGLPLQTSLNLSRGDERLLLEALIVAEQKLKEARGVVVNGFHGDPALLAKAASIHALAQAIYEEMEEEAAVPRRKNPKSRRSGK